ncbi:MAG: reverse transcriptase-like protein [Candidatus Saccharimonadales bacterium]
MWQETKHGLYKQFNFDNFKAAWAFMMQVADLAEHMQHHPRWENEWSVVQIWLITHEGGHNITEKDRSMAEAIDALLAAPLPTTMPASTAVPDEVKIFSDGGSRGNPGPSASGFVIVDMEDNVLVDRGQYMGITTNNQAEYNGLKEALEECQKLGVKRVHSYMDSMLVVNQMKGIFKVKNRDLWPMHDAVVKLVQSFDQVEFDHVPREFNKLADAAVNRAMDEALGIDTNRVEVAAGDNS